MKTLLRFTIPVLALIASFFILHNITKAENGFLTLKIDTSSNFCTYDTSLNLGTQDVNLHYGLIFSGQFSGAFSCTSLNGANVSLTMQMSGDLTNSTNHIIPATNVEVQTSPNQVIAGECFTGVGTTTRTPINSPQVIVSKIGNAGQVCTTSTTGVRLKITTSTGQAVGIYTGTMVLTMY